MENYAKREIDEYGNVRYYNFKGQSHRTDGPAIELISGFKAWFINGKRHRLNGPAVKFPAWEEYWFIDDFSFKKSQHSRLCLFSILESRRIDLRSTEDND